MITLGIETSGREGSVALIDSEELLGQRDLSREGRRHARTLLAELRELLREANLTPRDVSTLAVSLGPGSFTGLRVGVTCAKTWAYATGCDVVGVDTFLAVAERSSADAQTLHVIGDAQRGELFVGRYVRQEDHSWQSAGDILIVKTESWIRSLLAGAAVSGSAVIPLRERLAGRVDLEAPDRCHPRAEEVARIGQRLCSAGVTDDLWQLEPLYLRRSAAEEKAEHGAQSTP